MAKGEGWGGGLPPQPPISYLVTYELFETLMYCVPPPNTKTRGHLCLSLIIQQFPTSWTRIAFVQRPFNLKRHVHLATIWSSFFPSFSFFPFIFSTLYQVSGIRFFLLSYVLVRDRMSLMTLMKQKEEGSSESKVLRFWLVDVPLSILKSHSNMSKYRKTCLNFGFPDRKLVFSPHLWQYELFPFKDLKASLLHTGIKYT